MDAHLLEDTRPLPKGKRIDKNAELIYQAMLEHVTAGYGPGLTADVAFGAQTQSRFDSHPSPAERIRALGVDPQGLVVRPQASQPATALLRDPEGVQAALVACAPLRCRLGLGKQCARPVG